MGRTRTTHTVARLPIPKSAYEFIAQQLRKAGYEHVFIDECLIDMTGIAIEPMEEPEQAEEVHVPEAAR